MQDIINALLQALVKEALPHVVQAAAQHLQGGNQQGQQGGGFGGAAQQAQGGFGGTSSGGFSGAAQAAQGGFGGGAAQQGGGMFGGNGATGQQQAQVTPEMIQALIVPLVQNERVKAVLTQQMQEMGIQNLPDARNDQLPELYQRFQNVKQQAEAAGLLGAQQGGGTPSLI